MQIQSDSPALIYVYAFIPTEEYDQHSWVEADGMEPPQKIEGLRLNDMITAVTCKVPEKDYSQDILQKKVEDMEWLQGRAFHHHEVMNQLHENFTVIPLKFGTIYEQADHLTKRITIDKENIQKIFAYLSEKEEWNIKIYVEEEKYIKNMMDQEKEVERKKEEIEKLSPGKRFFEKKKLDQFAEEKAKENIQNTCRAIHEKLCASSFNEEVKKNWERKVTGRNDEMNWNGVYLIKTDSRDKFLDIVENEQRKAEETGAGISIAVTGPWPAYHFSDM
ncbi:GvpL/GvpF family gas vesicle protein [Salibacterium aidingense]|uniref:GvpL/GvpF family gas vesicle protein n=1 Tax=Salibacterium aidingense TaxID=384933 RepID=UPI0003FDF6D7|nr:GvpL/GvpF family gas vesicle protein [Salibacterium aidingense]